MSEVPFYQITLPLPTSVNAMHTIGRGFFNKKTGKYQRVNTRSSEYKTWLDYASISYRNTFPCGVQKFKGRLRVDYIFVWNDVDKGRDSSDIGNREKVLSDFLEKKFYENDNQIDEQHQYRRISSRYQNCVILRIYEIPDRRYEDPMLIFS